MYTLTRFWNVIRGRRLDADLQLEFETHLALIEDEERANGLSVEQARRKARTRFGSPLGYREQARDAVIARWLDTLWQDVRYGVRQLVGTPILSVVLIATLGLGIGATVAIFSVVNAVLLRPLPFADADRLVVVWETLRDLKTGRASVGHFRDWTDQATVFDATAAVQAATYNLTGTGDPERVSGTRVTPGYFRVAYITPTLGRYFNEEEGQRGDHVVVLSYGFWQRRFGGDPSVLDRDIQLSGETYRVIGVAPAAYALTDSSRGAGTGGFSSEIWTPLAFSPQQLANYGTHSYLILAKLKSGVSRASAQTDLERVTRGIAERNPQNMASRGVNVQSGTDGLLENIRIQLWVLLAFVACVLLIGCANVSSLLLARATTRRKEIAIRAAIGGGRRRIVRQLLTEGLVLAVAGGLVGLGVAALGVRFLVISGPPEVPRLAEAGLQADVLLFAFVTTLLTGLVFSMAPASRAARADLQGALSESGRSSLSHGREGVRAVLVVAQITLTVVLLVTAGLFIRSIVLLDRVPVGFNSTNVLTARLSLPPDRYQEAQSVAAAYGQILEHVRAIPGVERAGASTNVPMSGGNADAGMTVEGKTYARGSEPLANVRLITDGYFEAMRMALRRGRLFQAADMAPGTPRVIVINEKLATTLWADADPVGKRISLWTAGTEPEWREVVGVVGDVRSFGPALPVQPEVFFPYTQDPPGGWAAFQRSMIIVVQTAREQADSAAALRRAVWSVDASLPLYQIRSLNAAMTASIAARRFNMQLLALLAVTALALAGIGLYGVIAYFVTQRTPEIGLRLALGASARSVIAIVLRRSVALAAIGITVGIGAAFAATRAISSLLFGVSANDATTYVLGAAGLFAVALFASALPAFRATRVDPARSLTGS